MAETSYNSLEEERLATCSVRPKCKAPDDDMMLRSIRTGRLLCSKCYVHTPTGYIGSDEAKASDDRYFKGTTNDYIVTAAIIFPLSLIACTVAMFIDVNILGGWFGWMIAFMIGSGAGTFIARTARNATGKRVGRQSAVVAIGAVALAALMAPSVFYFVSGYGLFFNLSTLDLAAIICAAGIGVVLYNSFMRRI